MIPTVETKKQPETVQIKKGKIKMQISVEEKKTEAVKRMRNNGVPEEYIAEFEKTGCPVYRTESLSDEREYDYEMFDETKDEGLTTLVNRTRKDYPNDIVFMVEGDTSLGRRVHIWTVQDKRS